MLRPLLSLVGSLLAAAVLLAADPPRLVVVIVVDQMRADYIDRFRGQWTAGLKRLVDEGSEFTRAEYPYLATVTCPGHATIATGTFPHVHGAFQNTWFDRERGRMVACTDDSTVAGISYENRPPGHHSAAALRVPTLADEMRRGGSRVVTMALKARSAIMLAGHGGDAVTWLSESTHGWETSSAFTPTPVPEVAAFINAHPIDADFGKTWSRMLPLTEYAGVDDGEGENPPKGWTPTFPHVLRGGPEDTAPNQDFYVQWERSPFADAYVGRLAAALTTEMRLGQGTRPDFLGVGFSSPDMVGHKFGPRSQEIQDMYANLDRVVGALLDHLDRTVGKGAYVVVLTADHGVSDIPEQVVRAGGDAGRISSRGIRDAAQQAAESVLGPGSYLARVSTNDVYFAPGTYEKVSRNPDALKTVTDAIARRPGVQRVFTSEELAAGAGSTDPLLKAAALTYVPGRSGDLVLLPKVGWMATTDATTHGSRAPDDRRVPLVIFGHGIRQGRYSREVTPADIAPTLASMVGLTLRNVEGRVLREALR